MPTYVYRRPDGTLFEAFQKMSDPPLTTDPETGAPVERVISGGAGLQFKGTGFYLTDYGRAGSDGNKEKGGEAKKVSKGDGETKKDTPAAKPARDTKAAPAPKATSGD